MLCQSKKSQNGKKTPEQNNAFAENLPHPRKEADTEARLHFHSHESKG
jgi:hypothetical protein